MDTLRGNISSKPNNISEIKERILGELKVHWSNIIKKNIALHGLAYVISRAVIFNCSPYPATIEAIGVGSSVLRSIKEIGDIDIIVYYKKDELYDEWKQFENMLMEKYSELYDMAIDVSTRFGRASMDLLISIYKGHLIRLGFKRMWVEEWFPWINISDIWWGAQHGVPIVSFSLNTLIKRFLKYKWRRKRIDIHLADIDERSFSTIPHVIIWRKSEGIIKPSITELKRVFEEELKELVKISRFMI